MGSIWVFAEEEVEFYRREGWLLVEDVLSRRDLSELDGAIQTVADAALVDNNEAAYVEFEQEDTSSHPALRRMFSITLRPGQLSLVASWTSRSARWSHPAASAGRIGNLPAWSYAARVVTK